MIEDSTVTEHSLPIADTAIATDPAIASDSITVTDPTAVTIGMVLDSPPIPHPATREDSSFGTSIIIGIIVLLFCITGLRFRNDRKRTTALFRQIIEVRERNNVFDETVHETLILVLLNIIWAFSAGIILHAMLMSPLFPHPESLSSTIEEWPALSKTICIAVMMGYSAIMTIAYTIVGNVFSDSKNTSIWVKGFATTQGFLSLPFLPISLMILFYPDWRHILLIIALFLFVLAKLVFIWKGFRIFFTQISSWVLFLYYLCSLELVPLIITYLSAVWLCGLLKA